MPAVTLQYLEMLSPDDLRGKPQPMGLTIMEAQVKDYRFNRFLYQLVGEPWQWTDKLVHTDDQWQSYAEAKNLRTFVAYHRGSIAGYYELRQHPENNVEIAYFGLSPKFIGKGFGGYLLTHAIENAWCWGPTKRVWVYTCSLDHPNAIHNYQARGLQIYKTEERV
ncbi:GNAT family N-acetyltransferase [Teredinibacter turnerae]|uniref:GNAT family N-acetyltransferase n=1 Tax=Teredinibacter turnerae TaxID=2426 RepID=UPI00037E74B7|nr:GNAT family N-acetyltransferase [Teredinibacter turnerae]